MTKAHSDENIRPAPGALNGLRVLDLATFSSALIARHFWQNLAQTLSKLNFQAQAIR